MCYKSQTNRNYSFWKESKKIKVRNVISIQEIFNANISNSKITIVNSQHKNTNSIGDFVLVLKVSGGE